MPHITTVTKEDSSTSQKPVYITTTEYDTYGNLTLLQDPIGRTTETKYLTISRTDTETNFQVVDWTREKVNPSGLGNMLYIGTDYEYDTYGNVKYAESKEWYTAWNTVTETLDSSQRINLTGSYLKQLPIRSTQAVLQVRSSTIMPTSCVEYEVRYWAIGEPRPITPYAYRSYVGGTSDVATDTFTIALDSLKQYNVEVKAVKLGGFGSLLTMSSLDVTYSKSLTTSSKTKTATHYSYANAATSSLPNKVHTEYGTLKSSHIDGFSNDNCIKTEYEYSGTAFEGAFMNENYNDLAPTKITQYYTDVDGNSKTLVTNLKYNRHGNITSIKRSMVGNAYVLENQYIYDGYGRLNTEIYRDSTRVLQKDYAYTVPTSSSQYATTTITHQENVGSAVLGKSQHVTKYSYNGLGQLVETKKGPLGQELTIQKISYDSYGGQEYVIDGLDLKTQTLHDQSNRPVEVRIYDKAGTYPTYKKIIYNDITNQVTEEIYDLKNGVHTRVGKTVQQLDKGGRVLSVDQYPQASGTTYYRIQYTYNLADQVTSMTDPKGVTLSYEYDIFGLIKAIYPGNIRGDDGYVYEFPGNKKQVKRQISGTTMITTEFDELDRVKKVAYSDGRIVKNYYDSVGRLSRSILTSSNQNTEIAYQYDVTGNVKQATHKYDGMEFNVGYGYDEKGNMTQITYPGGYSVSYEYDLYGRVVRVPQFVEGLEPEGEPDTPTPPPTPTPTPNPPTKPGDIIIDDPNPIDLTRMSFTPLTTSTLPGVRYKANGFIEAIRYANGVTTTYTDDSMGRIQQIKNPVYELNYGYDGKGNVTSITGSNGVAIASTYKYYDNDWLKEARQGQNVYLYVYDAAGNCTKKTINGVQTVMTYDPQSVNILTSINGKSVSHDTRGNMTQRGDTGSAYTYDHGNQLTVVMKNGQNVGQYFYNSEGKRYKKVENGQSTYYVYSGEMLLQEVKPDGAVVNYIYLNGKQIAKVEGSKKYYYHTDHLGSTRAITDEIGNVVGRFEYQPFGLEESSSTGADTLTFTGKMQDEPTGLMYFNARYYDPTLGRFMTEDPAKDGGNWYHYCRNNPLKFYDPDGEKVVGVDITGAAAAVGGIEGGITVAFDDQGNIGLFSHIGINFQFGAVANVSVGGFVSPHMPSIDKIAGLTFWLGGSVGPWGGAFGITGDGIAIYSVGKGVIGPSYFPAEGHLYIDVTVEIVRAKFEKTGGWQEVSEGLYIMMDPKTNAYYVRSDKLKTTVVYYNKTVKVYQYGGEEHGKLLYMMEVE